MRTTIVFFALTALIVGCSSNQEPQAAETRFVAADTAELKSLMPAYAAAFLEAYRNGKPLPTLSMKDGRKFSSGDVTNALPGATADQIAAFQAANPSTAGNAVNEYDSAAFEAFLVSLVPGGSRSGHRGQIGPVFAATDLGCGFPIVFFPCDQYGGGTCVNCFATGCSFGPGVWSCGFNCSTCFPM